jgi:hypothetical protein
MDSFEQVVRLLLGPRLNPWVTTGRLGEVVSTSSILAERRGRCESGTCRAAGWSLVHEGSAEHGAQPSPVDRRLG